MKANALILTLAVSSIVALNTEAVPMHFVMSLAQGANLVANPFVVGSGNVNVVLPDGCGVPDGSVIHNWDASSQQWVFGGTFIEGAGWLNADFTDYSSATVDIFGGALIITPRSADLKLREPEPLPVSASPEPQCAGLTMRSIPVGGVLGDVCPTLKDGDTILIYSKAQQRFLDPLVFLESPDYTGWIDSDLQMVEPVIGPGVAFFYNHRP